MVCAMAHLLVTPLLPDNPTARTRQTELLFRTVCPCLDQLPEFSPFVWVTVRELICLKVGFCKFHFQASFAGTLLYHCTIVPTGQLRGRKFQKLFEQPKAAQRSPVHSHTVTTQILLKTVRKPHYSISCFLNFSISQFLNFPVFQFCQTNNTTSSPTLRQKLPTSRRHMTMRP